MTSLLFSLIKRLIQNVYYNYTKFRLCSHEDGLMQWKTKSVNIFKQENFIDAWHFNRTAFTASLVKPNVFKLFSCLHFRVFVFGMTLVIKEFWLVMKFYGMQFDHHNFNCGMLNDDDTWLDLKGAMRDDRISSFSISTSININSKWNSSSQTV